MNILKRLFRRTDVDADVSAAFWSWFSDNEKVLNKTLRADGQRRSGFIEKIMPHLQKVNPGFFMLAGIISENDKAELIVSAEGEVKHFVFVEDFIKAAPQLDNWEFTALKPGLDIDLEIEYRSHRFNTENITFCSVSDATMPDNIDLIINHEALHEGNQDEIAGGVYLFLENLLGELNMATSIDGLKVSSLPKGADVIPITKLKHYLAWREKEFVEKYSSVYLTAQRDQHSIMEGRKANGMGVVAIINQGALQWDAKMSHPWILTIAIKYDGKRNQGMPGREVMEWMARFEDELLQHLRDFDGYVYIGRETGDNRREIYMACKEFREVSRIVNDLATRYIAKLTISYELYKDKYWRSFARYNAFG